MQAIIRISCTNSHHSALLLWGPPLLSSSVTEAHEKLPLGVVPEDTEMILQSSFPSENRDFR